MTARDRKQIRTGLLFVSPWLIGFSVFVALPILSSLWYSLCDYSVLRPPLYLGAKNYIDLAHDAVFWQALYNTLFFAALFLPLATVTSITLALLLNTGVRGMPLYRTIFFLPSLTPMVALAIIWRWVLNGEYGVLNHFLNTVLRPLGMEAPNWLGSVTWAKPALVMMSLWTLGHAMVIYLAGLQDVPKQLYEAADIDGASWFSKLRHVTIPLLSPVIFFNVIVGLINTLQVFTLPYVVTDGEGGPARATTFFAVYLYNLAFRYLRMGYASAMAWIMFIIILTLTLVILRMVKDRVYYAGK
jgi:multiple sugar transport system permease protein